MPLVGRQREIAALRSALADTLSGSGGIVMLAGEPGIGKTRLAEELAGLAKQEGIAVSRGRSHEAEGAPPFWPWIQALREPLGHNRATELPGLVGLASSDAETRDPASARFRLYDAIATSVRQASRKQPMLLMLEDLHWADQPSLLLLEFLAHELSRTQTLLLGTYRDVELSSDHPLNRASGELARARARTIRLEGLSQEEVGLLLHAVTGSFPSAELLRSVYHQTEGNPFFVTEIAHMLAQEDTHDSRSLSIPNSVKAVIRRRLSKLSRLCRDVLSTAAVIGREFDFEILTALRADVAEAQLLNVIDEARQGHVVVEMTERTERYHFRHALIQQTLYEDVSVSRRVRQHARIAETLEALRGDEHASQLAHHYAQARSPAKLVRYSMIAGTRALSTHGYENALSHFGAAWEAKKDRSVDSESAEILFGLGIARAATSARWNRQDAWAHLKAAIEYFIASGNIARAMEAVTHPALTPEGTEDVGPVAQQVLDLIAPGSRDAGRVAARHAAATYFEKIDYPAAVDGFRRATSLARRHKDDALELRTLAYETAVDHFHIRWTDVLAKSARAIELAKQNDDPHAEIYARYRSAYTLMCTGRSDEVRLHVVSDLTRAERLGDRGLVGDALYICTALAQLEGNWCAAREHSDRGLEVSPYQLPLLHNRVLLEHELGNPDGAAVYLERLADACNQSGPYPLRNVFAVLATSQVARFTDQHEETNAIPDRPCKPSVPMTAVTLDIARAMVAAQHRDLEAVEDLLERLAPFRGLILAPCLVTDRLLGRLAHLLGRAADASRYFEGALIFCRDAGYRPELAWTCYDYGSALAERDGKDDRTRAASLLDEASALADELGMHPLAGFVSEFMRFHRSKLVPKPDGLSRRELEVLKLVAKGLTNKEIAARLFISANTVAVHVARILEKTESSNRTEAANYAFREHLT